MIINCGFVFGKLSCDLSVSIEGVGGTAITSQKCFAETPLSDAELFSIALTAGRRSRAGATGLALFVLKALSDCAVVPWTGVVGFLDCVQPQPKL